MKRVLVAALLCAGALVACGDDDGAGVREIGGSGDASGAGSASGNGAASGGGSGAAGDAPVDLEGTVNNHGIGAPDGGSIEVELDDFYFGPTFVETVSGSKVTVELHNEGDVAHTFTIEGTDIDVEVQPGDTAEAVVDVGDNLPVEFYCRFHEAQGMQGAFFRST